MKKKGMRRIVSLMFAVLLALSSFMTDAGTVFADVGDKVNGDTGLSTDISTSDTISLPIKIYDYLNDGMLFEYAEAQYEGTQAGYVNGNTPPVVPALTVGDSTVMLGNDYTTAADIGGYYPVGSTMTSANLAKEGELQYAFVRGSSTSGQGAGGRACALPTDFGSDHPVPKNAVRYVVVVYRANFSTGDTTGQIKFWLANDATNWGRNNNYSTSDITIGVTGQVWQYVVIDMKNGNLNKNWDKFSSVSGVWCTYPMAEKNEWMDISHIAYFSTQEAATEFGQKAVAFDKNPGKSVTWNMGNNRAFGLLRGSNGGGWGNNGGNSTLSNGYYTYDVGYGYPANSRKSNSIEEGIYQVNCYNNSGNSIDMSNLPSQLGYTLYTTMTSGLATIGLLEPTLGEDRIPVYREEAVDYVADLLSKTLPIPVSDSSGNYNYNYVKGTASSLYGGVDLATALRNRITGLGTYAEAKAKNLKGTWTECEGKIETYYDAAYFLLNNLFVAGSYNEPQDDYNYLVLSRATTDDGSEAYVFDAGFTDSTNTSSAQSSVKYDTVNKTISNTSAASKTMYVYEGTSETTLYPFLPVTDHNNESGQTVSPYFLDPGVANTDSAGGNYNKRDFNYVMQATGEFVYHADDDLFFEFEGDDDVYLFINGQLVLDIGGAHGITGERFNLNEYVETAKASVNAGSSSLRDQALNLQEGQSYSFDFYYMERHGYGANMRIVTNIRVTDPDMKTEKTAYQNEKQLAYGSIIDKNIPVEYGFRLTNSGNANLTDLTFSDSDIGVAFNYTDGMVLTGDRVYKVDGTSAVQSVDEIIGDIRATVTDAYGVVSETTFSNNEELKKYLDDIELAQGETIEIRGFAYKLTNAQISAGVFDNQVFTSATDGTHPLSGSAQMRVFVPSDPMYYEWNGHDLQISKDKLVEDVLSAANSEDNILHGKVPNLTNASQVSKVETCISSGSAITIDEVEVGSDNKLTIRYESTGAHVFYVKLTYDGNKTVVVPILVNVTDVQDSVYVLDYGLQADLTENGELYKNDTLSVPGRDTAYTLEGMTSGNEAAPSYTPNHINFGTVESNITKTYGEYETNGESLKYKPTEFMEGADTVYTAVRVYEGAKSNSAIGNININREVEMYKSVTTIPATVVYYEDDFPAIKYKNTSNEITADGTSANLTQSVDQTEAYGHDQVYEAGTNTEKSGGTLHTIIIKRSGEVASFEFKGTGFELISRTNAVDSATITVKVYNGDGTLVKNIPVITEFDNGADGGTEEIYQVPVIRVKDLAYGSYTVSISGVPARDYDNVGEDGTPAIIDTYLYLDGLRIYQPLDTIDEEAGETNKQYAEDNYIAEEKDADVMEIRDLIAEARVAAASYDDTVGLKINSGTSMWTENRNGDMSGQVAESVDDYLRYGPNNEVYLTEESSEALVFYLRENAESNVHNLQVAVRGIDYGLFTGCGELGVEALIRYGIALSNGTYGWETIQRVTSSAEQYYTIDYTKCPYIEGKGYQVVIAFGQTNSEMGMASFSSLKLNGLTLVENTGEAATLKYVDGVLTRVDQDSNGTITETAVDAGMYPVFMSLRQQLTVVSTDESGDTVSGEPEKIEIAEGETAGNEPMGSETAEGEVTEGEITEEEIPEEVTEDELSGEEELTESETSGEEPTEGEVIEGEIQGDEDREVTEGEIQGEEDREVTEDETPGEELVDSETTESETSGEEPKEGEITEDKTPEEEFADEIPEGETPEIGQTEDEKVGSETTQNGFTENDPVYDEPIIHTPDTGNDSENSQTGNASANKPAEEEAAAGEAADQESSADEITEETESDEEKEGQDNQDKASSEEESGIKKITNKLMNWIRSWFK